MLEVILLDILARPADRSRGRHNPRAVKRKMTRFPTRVRAQPLAPHHQQLVYQSLIRIVCP